jgi:hypothetical protein
MGASFEALPQHSGTFQDPVNAQTFGAIVLTVLHREALSEPPVEMISVIDSNQGVEFTVSVDR